MDEPTALLKPLRFDLVPDDPALLPVRLVFGPQLVIGRNKDECDLVTWFLPRNEENDRETRKLSQVHAILQHEGGKVRIRDADSGAGTFWNQQPVPPGEGVTTPIGPTGKLALGRNYGIDLEWFPVATPTCAVLQPITSEPAFRRCLWMIGARCAMRRFQGESGAAWILPSHAENAADAVLEIRQGELWWQAGAGSPTEVRSAARLALADSEFVVA